MFSGKIILYFGVQKRLRAFLYPIFTGGVVAENGSCSAAFSESVALQEITDSLPSSGAMRQLPPAGEGFSLKLYRHAKGSPFGRAGERSETERARLLPAARI